MQFPIKLMKGHGQVPDLVFALYHQSPHLPAPDSLGCLSTSFSSLLAQIQFAHSLELTILHILFYPFIDLLNGPARFSTIPDWLHDLTTANARLL